MHARIFAIADRVIATAGTRAVEVLMTWKLIFSDKPPGRGLAYDSGFEVFLVMLQVELALFELFAIDISSPAKSSTATQNLPIAQAYLAGAPRIGRGLVIL